MGRSRRREFLRGFLASVAVALTLLAANQASPDQRPEISVATAAELIDALKPEQGARRIRMRAGRYTLAAPLSVPDGFELTGESVMQLDPGGLPAGFVAGTETAIVAGEQLHEDVVTLGDGTLLHGLRIEGRALGPAQGGAATGNIVMIASRRPGHQLSATLRECEIVNHSGAGFNSIGPTGRAIVVMTRPRAAGAAWHQGARVSAAIERSIVRNTSGGNAVFAINFAGGGAIALDFEHNRFEESLVVSGGVGRPHKVTGANVTLRSRGNLYVSAGGSFPVGWGILGGSSAPHEPLTEGAESNSVRIEAHDDRIEGYRIGINAAGGRQIAGMPGTVKHNRSELLLSGLRIKTVGDGAADLVLHGALLETEPGASAAALNSAEDNMLQVTLQDSTGSGRRENVYADRWPPEFAAVGAVQHSDRLEFTGTRALFLESNTAFDPAPNERSFPRTPGAPVPGKPQPGSSPGNRRANAMSRSDHISSRESAPLMTARSIMSPVGAADGCSVTAKSRRSAAECVGAPR